MFNTVKNNNKNCYEFNIFVVNMANEEGFILSSNSTYNISAHNL